MSRLILHITTAPEWTAAKEAGEYRAPSLETEGFIHCTDGADAMVATATRHYTDVPGDFVVLTVDLDDCGSPWRIDDPGKPYPHIYGPIDRAAILEVASITRDPDGRFVRIDRPDDATA